MHVTLIIEDDFKDSKNKDNHLEIWQSLLQNVDGVEKFFPARTELAATFSDEGVTWITLMRALISTVEQHYGYSIKDDLEKLYDY